MKKWYVTIAVFDLSEEGANSITLEFDKEEGAQALYQELVRLFELNRLGTNIKGIYLD